MIYNKRFLGKFFILCSLTLLLSMFLYTTFLHPSSAHAANITASSTSSSLVLGTGVSGVTVFVEPAAGETPILDAINNAQSSVYVELYLLTDTNVITALENAAQNGLDVRVMLDPSPYGVGSSGPAATLSALSSYGVQTEDSNPAFTYPYPELAGVTFSHREIECMATTFLRTSDLAKGLGVHVNTIKDGELSP